MIGKKIAVMLSFAFVCLAFVGLFTGQAMAGENLGENVTRPIEDTVPQIVELFLIALLVAAVVYLIKLVKGLGGR